MTTPNNIEKKVEEFSKKWHDLGIPNGCLPHMQEYVRQSLTDAEERARTEGFIEGADATAIQQSEIILSHLSEIEKEAQGETAYDAIQRVRAFIQSLTPNKINH